jgi:hypothetical protein
MLRTIFQDISGWSSNVRDQLFRECKGISIRSSEQGPRNRTASTTFTGQLSKEYRELVCGPMPEDDGAGPAADQGDPGI